MPLMVDTIGPFSKKDLMISISNTSKNGVTITKMELLIIVKLTLVLLWLKTTGELPVAQVSVTFSVSVHSHQFYHQLTHVMLGTVSKLNKKPLLPLLITIPILME
jgi:hypothetical protein